MTPAHHRMGIDFDSTIWPTYEVWAHITGNRKFASENILRWNDPIDWAGGLEPFMTMVQRSHLYETMRQFQPLPGAIKALVNLQERGVHQTLITARQDHELETIVQILDDHGYTPQLAVSRKGIDKTTYCLEHGITVLVEDEPDTMRVAHEAGIKVASLRYPYNAAVIDDLGLTWGNTWNELHPLIGRLLGLDG